MIRWGGARLLTHRLDSVAQWWATILGVAPAARTDRHALFVVEGGTVTVTRLDIAFDPVPETVGVAALTLSADPDGLLAALERARDAAIVPEIGECDGLTFSILFHDPDRNGVRLELEPEAEARAAWLAAQPLDREPLAEEIDVDELEEALRRGEDVSRGFHEGGLRSRRYVVPPMEEDR